MLNSYVVQLITTLFKGQCRHLIDSDDVVIVFPGCPLYLFIKQVRLCTQNCIRAAHFSSLNEPIFLQLLVGVALKIEANPEQLTDLIDFFFFLFNFGDFKVNNLVGKYG
jgi:hypothetical protein